MYHRQQPHTGDRQAWITNNKTRRGSRWRMIATPQAVGVTFHHIVGGGVAAPTGAAVDMTDGRYRERDITIDGDAHDEKGSR